MKQRYYHGIFILNEAIQLRHIDFWDADLIQSGLNFQIFFLDRNEVTSL